MVIDFVWGSKLEDLACIHDRDPVGHGERFFLVVGDIDEGNPDLAVEFLQFDLHRFPEFEIESAEGFVEQEDLRAIDECAGECNPLLLTTRERSRFPMLDMGEADEFECLADPAFTFFFGDAGHFESVPDVLRDGHVRKERVVLKDRVDWPFVGWTATHVVAMDEQSTRVRVFESADHPERRGFATSGWSEHRQKLTRLDGQREIINGEHIAIAFADAFQFDTRYCAGRLGLR